MGVITLSEFLGAYVSSVNKSKGRLRNDLMSAFSYFDADGSGHLTHDELRSTFSEACPFPVSDALFERIWATCDANADGVVEFQEFVDAVTLSPYDDTAFEKMLDPKTYLTFSRGRFGSMRKLGSRASSGFV